VEQVAVALDVLLQVAGSSAWRRSVCPCDCIVRRTIAISSTPRRTRAYVGEGSLVQSIGLAYGGRGRFCVRGTTEML
jgi:hypothetical protein